MPRKNPKLETMPRKSGAPAKKTATGKPVQAQPPLVSGRWLLSAVGITLAGAALCGWLALCLLFWQGSWQLLYHPQAAVEKTPASAGLAFSPVAFAATDEGEPRLKGWWIPAAPGSQYGRLTVLYLHGPDGNLGDTIDALARLHAIGVNVLAFDYRGYGQSRFARPSEAHWRQDAGWALEYLEGTLHAEAGAVVLDGEDLGANLALEMAAAHPDLAGVIVEQPAADPVGAIFDDARARMVPARLMVHDRYDLDAAAAAVRIQVLWFQREGNARMPPAYEKVAARKTIVWVNPAKDIGQQYTDATKRWMDGLGTAEAQ